MRILIIDDGEGILVFILLYRRSRELSEDSENPIMLLMGTLLPHYIQPCGNDCFFCVKFYRFSFTKLVVQKYS